VHQVCMAHASHLLMPKFMDYDSPRCAASCGSCHTFTGSIICCALLKVIEIGKAHKGPLPIGNGSGHKAGKAGQCSVRQNSWHLEDDRTNCMLHEVAAESIRSLMGVAGSRQ
jgi:hypothetical protein